MSTTFWTWVIVAAVAGGTLLLLLGMPAADEEAPLVLESAPAEAAQADSVEGIQYWEVVTSSPVATPTMVSTSQPCSACGVSQSSPVIPVSTAAVPCYQQPPSPCGAVPCSHQVPSPCGPVPCVSLPTNCRTVCDTGCPLVNPGINRNLDPCVDECTFVQLHTTIPQPICTDVWFNWSASKGSFLDPTIPDPIFYVPSTQFTSGEDVWIVLTVTSGDGIQYTDQMKLHVVDSR